MDGIADVYVWWSGNFGSWTALAGVILLNLVLINTKLGNGPTREKVTGILPIALSWVVLSPTNVFVRRVMSSSRIITGRFELLVKEPPCTERYAGWCERTDRDFFYIPIFLLDLCSKLKLSCILFPPTIALWKNKPAFNGRNPGWNVRLSLGWSFYFFCSVQYSTVLLEFQRKIVLWSF